jgi:hypothetical protein
MSDDREGARHLWEQANRDVANAKTDSEKRVAKEALQRAESRLDFEFGPEADARRNRRGG